MKKRTTVATAVAAGAMLLPAVPAAAEPGTAKDATVPVVATGTCSAGTAWQLAAVARGRGIGVRFALDSVAGNQRWIIAGAHNLRQADVVVRKTNTDGKLAVRRHVRNFAGVDVFRVRAKNTVTKEICKAKLTY